jgi:hypothetical protein
MSRGDWAESLMLPAAGLLLAAAGTMGCQIPGDGEGEVTSSKLFAQDCWSDAYQLRPDFFATVPFRDTQQIRLQRGSDLHEVSDGVAVLVNQVSTIRPTKCVVDSDCASGLCLADAAQCPADFEKCCSGDDLRGQTLNVGLPPKLVHEIAPEFAAGDPPPVSIALYLQFSCHNQNVVLYAIDGTITFTELFNGDPNETAGDEKLTDATFDVRVADPRHADPGTLEIPDEKTSQLTGWFRFFFKRGQPGQPFP